MSDILDENGLTLKTATEILDELIADMKAIFGDDINVDQDSPDGQTLRNIQQQATDVRDMIAQTYTSFDPDQAIGVVLDQRVSINGIERISGDFTIQPVTITYDRALTLQGLDENANDPDATDAFTVQDDQGNQFLLIDTFEPVAAGSQSLSFRARQLGKVETTINTITTQTTVVIGVTDVNNPSAATTVGNDQETDFELRKRRRASVANSSVGYVDSIEGGLNDVDGVVEARVYENEEDTTSPDGLPPHSVWCIVEGGANTDIGAKIYEKKDAGCTLKGSITVDVLRPNNRIFVAKFDRPTPEDLYIRFDLKVITPGASFDLDDIKQFLVDNLSYNIGDPAETSEITCLLFDYIADGRPLNVEVSNDGVSYVDFLEVSAIENKFTLATARIDITIIA